MKGTCEGFDGCECEYCSSQEESDCPLNLLRGTIKGLMVALNVAPSMYNEQGDVEMLRAFTKRYNEWAQNVRNRSYEDNKDEWLKVSQGLSDLHALRRISENLKAFDDVDLYNGDKVTVTIRKIDGTTKELDGDWLARSAAAELGETDE